MIKEKNSNTKKIKKTSKKPRNIFRYDEIESLVKSFVLAYIRGNVTIDLTVDASPVDGINPFKAKEMTDKQKDEFITNIEICSGKTDATSEELRNSVFHLFTTILECRSGKRIKGEFISIELERRLNEMEAKYEVTDNLVKEIYIRLTDEDNANVGKI